MKLHKILTSCFVFFTVIAFHSSVQAVALNGLMTIDGGTTVMVPFIDPATGLPVVDPSTGDVILVPQNSGSIFSMSSASVLLQPGSAGGIILGEYQNFVLDPDEPHPQGWQGDTNGDGIPDGSAGTGYGRTPVQEGTILMPFNFFGTPTYIGTNPVSYQSGDAHPAPTADVDMSTCVGDVCVLTVDLSAWEVMWNGSAFEQGPRDGGPFVMAEGTYNLVTHEYVLDWDSRIVGGPFSNVLAHWHLEGTVVPVPAAVWLFGSGLMALFGFARTRKV